MAQQPSVRTHVPIVIPIDAQTAISPPRSPFQAALSRLWAGLLVILPTLLTFIVDPLVSYLSRQAITLPDEWRQWQPVVAIVSSGAVAAYQSLRKGQKEGRRLEAAREMGLVCSDGTPTPRATTAARMAVKA